MCRREVLVAKETASVLRRFHRVVHRYGSIL